MNRIVFAGTPEFAASALEKILAEKFNVVAVYSQPDRPAGRGRKLQASPVKQLALKHDIPVYQPENLKDETAQRELAALKPDIMIVAAYGLLLPKAVLDIPNIACINIHASLLPRWRGAAPIQRAIESGDEKTGITIMLMDIGLDTGNMLLKKECNIEATDTTASLHDKLAVLGGEAMVDCLKNLQACLDGQETQDESLTNYAKKIAKQEGEINWQLDASSLARKVNAFNPWPITYSHWDDKTVRIWQALALDDNSNLSPGSVIQCDKNGIDVSTGTGCLRILKLQLPGAKAMDVADFVNAHDLNGAILK